MSKIYHVIFNLIALTVLIYVGIDVFYRFVGVKLTPFNSEMVSIQDKPDLKRNEKEPLGHFNVITDRNIFGSTLKNTPEEIKGPEVESLEPTSLKIALLGTVTGDRRNAFAVIEQTQQKTQGLYRVGDSVQNATLKMILRGKVVLRVGDRDEILIMEEPSSSSSPPEKVSRAAPPSSSGRTVLIRLSELNKSLQNINQLLTNVRIRPHFKNGVADGLMVTQIRAGSIFRRLGIRNGDIVQEINGQSIETPDRIISMYNDLKSGSPTSIKIMRRGRQEILNYRFRK